MNKGKVKSVNTNQLIQVAVVCLAVVSFYTTGQGMKAYIFNNNQVIAYASSAAIQGILLAMSVNLPEYIRNTFAKIRNKEEKKNKLSLIISIIISLLILILTIVTMFCSSWFSYIYIAETVHFDSWQTESELLVRQTYRNELYNAKDYAHNYRVYLEDSFGNKILELEELADELKDGDLEGLDLDWENERKNYGEGDDLASSNMMLVINAMEAALSTDTSQNEREQAVRAVADAKQAIGERQEAVNINLDTIEKNIAKYTSQVESLTQKINDANSESDSASLQNSLDDTMQLLESATEKRISYQDEYNRLDEADSRLQVYESHLGLSSTSSSISIKSRLLEMQSEFFKEDIDEKALLETATSVFENLRNASSYNDKDDLAYMNLLTKMNQLILNLKEYADIKEVEEQLEESIKTLSLEEEAAEEENWKEKWRELLKELQARVSSMPTYSDSSNNKTELLSESQYELLQKYDRIEVSNLLDDIIRFYVTDHNALYQGLIYLNSSYNELAKFCLVLAFAFDISGFILGFVQVGETDEEEIKGEKIRNDNKSTAWTVLATMNKYRILTGDYEKKDDIYSYQTFTDGELQNWKVDDEASYDCGIYKQAASVETKGIKISDERQNILFVGQQAGPQDGIYSNGYLKFDEGSLFFADKEDGEKKEVFLTNLNEYVPVYSYSLLKGECKTIPAMNLGKESILAKLAVIALNKKGSRVAAIYVLED